MAKRKRLPVPKEPPATKEELADLEEAKDELEGDEVQPIEKFSFLIQQWRIIGQQKANLEGIAELNKRLAVGLPTSDRKPLIDEAKRALEQIPRLQQQRLMMKRDMVDLLAANPGIRNRVDNWRQIFPNMRYPVVNGLKARGIDVSSIVEKVKELEKLQDAEEGE